MDPGTLHAAAVIALLWNDTSGNSLRRSVSSLRTASRLADQSPAILIDLAAALVVRAERHQTPRDLLEAIEASDLALRMDPRNAPARFNLALALDRLGLVDRAARAWHAYLQVDSTSGWANEARWRLTPLERHDSVAPPSVGAGAGKIEKYVALVPQAARELAWDHVLGDWGQAVLDGRPSRADSLLRLAREIGARLANRGGDHSLADAVHAVDSNAHDSATVRRLATGHRDYAAGRAAHAAGDYRESRARFGSARRWGSVSPALSQWATLFLGITSEYGGARAVALAALRDVLRRVDSQRYPALAGRAHWAQGTVLLRTGRHDGVLEIREANRLFTRIDERENLGAVQYVEAEEDLELGDKEVGYGMLRRALTTLQPYPGSLWRHASLYVLTLAAAREGLYRAAVYAQDEGLLAAEQSGRKEFIVEARLSRARLRSALGDSSLAKLDVAVARSAVPSLPSEVARRRFAADLRVTEAVELARFPDRALAALDSVVDFFSVPVNAIRLLPAVLARAEAYRATGRLGRAAADLDRAVRLLDERRAEISSTPLQAMLLDAARGVFDRIVMMRIAEDRPAEALAYLERGRASLAPVRDRARSARLVRAAMPSGEIAVEYALIGDTLLIWTIHGASVTAGRWTIDSRRFLRAVERARASLEVRNAGSGALPHLTTLYDLLIRPVATRLGPTGTRLTVIADGEIAAIPFAALFDSTHKTYMVESYAVRALPALADAWAPATVRPRRPRALLVADPAFDPARFPQLPRLPGAAAEVATVALRYPEQRTLASADAHAQALEQEMRAANVVHYAGHAVFDEERPEQSYLALAPGPAHGGRLTAADVSRLELSGVGLVVLSACETMRAVGTRSGGFTGLTAAFLVAGAGGVVGSLWKVDDAFTKELMTAFHVAYGTTDDAAAALRTAQLELLHSPKQDLRSPTAWAGFRYAGR